MKWFLILMLFCCGCRSQVTGFHAVIPDNFRGVVVLEIDAMAISPTKDKLGRYIFRIPDSGKLKVRNDPFRAAHRWSAEFESGASIPCYPDDLGYTKTAVLFLELGRGRKGDGPDTITCFVGLESEVP